MKRLLLLVVLLSSVVGYSATPLPPPPENAALLYYQVFLVLKLPEGDNDTTWTMMRQYAEGKIPSSPTVRNAVDSLVIPKAYALKAAAIDKCDWGTDYSQGIDTVLPYLGPLRRVAWLLLTDARLQAEKGDFPTAVDRCLAAYRVSRHASNGLTFICFLVGNAMDNTAHECLRTILVKMPKDAPTLDRIRQRLRQVQMNRIPLTTLFEYDFQGVWTGLTLARLQTAITGYSNGKMAQRIRAHAGAADEREFVARSRATAKLYLTKQLAVLGSDMPYARKSAEINAIDDQLRREGESHEEAALATCVLASGANILTLAVRDQAAFNALDTAVDLYRIQLTTGRLPDALPDDTLKDPFSGKPFLYEKSDGHFTLRCQVMDLVKKEAMAFKF